MTSPIFFRRRRERRKIAHPRQDELPPELALSHRRIMQSPDRRAARALCKRSGVAGCRGRRLFQHQSITSASSAAAGGSVAKSSSSTGATSTELLRRYCIIESPDRRAASGSSYAGYSRLHRGRRLFQPVHYVGFFFRRWDHVCKIFILNRSDFNWSYFTGDGRIIKAQIGERLGLYAGYSRCRLRSSKPIHYVGFFFRGRWECRKIFILNRSDFNFRATSAISASSKLRSASGSGSMLGTAGAKAASALRANPLRRFLLSAFFRHRRNSAAKTFILDSRRLGLELLQRWSLRQSLKSASGSGDMLGTAGAEDCRLLEPIHYLGFFFRRPVGVSQKSSSSTGAASAGSLRPSASCIKAQISERLGLYAGSRRCGKPPALPANREPRRLPRLLGPAAITQNLHPQPERLQPELLRRSAHHRGPNRQAVRALLPVCEERKSLALQANRMTIRLFLGCAAEVRRLRLLPHPRLGQLRGKWVLLPAARHQSPNRRVGRLRRWARRQGPPEVRPASPYCRCRRDRPAGRDRLGLRLGRRFFLRWLGGPAWSSTGEVLVSAVEGLVFKVPLAAAGFDYRALLRIGFRAVKSKSAVSFCGRRCGGLINLRKIAGVLVDRLERERTNRKLNSPGFQDDLRDPRSCRQRCRWWSCYRAVPALPHRPLPNGNGGD